MSDNRNGPGRQSVSVVIPTFNNVRLLRDCLNSVRALKGGATRVETVVVDNGSIDGTAETVRTMFPSVRLVRMETNTGFAAACNTGASEAASEYLAFLNDDAVAEPDWLEGLFSGLRAGGEGAVCAASRIVSRDGREVEYSGASSNLFGVGRPRSAWGWPGALEPTGEGQPLLFASGGAMLVQRRVFLDAGGFDPEFFAYFEDVDLGWRLWLLGHRVVYAPGAVVRHTGGATGTRSAAHRRYTLWECNALATIFKNYETQNMERILTAAAMLLYRRALLATGDAINIDDYRLTGPKDTNTANVERLSKVSVAHLAAIDRFNSMLPHLLEERAEIQARRVRSDAEILPLLGQPWDPQFAGVEYAEAQRALVQALRLFDITDHAIPNRVLVIASSGEEYDARQAASLLKEAGQVALVLVGPTGEKMASVEDGIAVHRTRDDDPQMHGLVRQADAVVVYAGAASLQALHERTGILAYVGPGAPEGEGNTVSFTSGADPALLDFCRFRGTLASQVARS